MTPAALDDLIARVERATGPDRALDAEIAIAAGWTFHKDSLFDFWRAPGDEEHGEPLTFTGSVDAAMTLLGPPGHPLWTVTINGRSHGRRGMSWWAEVTVPSREFQGDSHYRPALALCAAALKARRS